MNFLQSILARGKGAGSVDNLDPSFATKLQAFAQAAPKPLTIQSGFRDNAQQQGLWDAAVQKYGSADAARKWVAPPGHSMHNRGDAVDLGYGGQGLGQGDPELIDWAHKNAANYGLTFPLPNENWHIEPIGARAASRSGGVGEPGVAGSNVSPGATTMAPGDQTAFDQGLAATMPKADTHSLLDMLHTSNPIEQQGMLSGMQDYSLNNYLSDAFSGQNPLRRAFYGSIAKLLG